ncbi:MAG: diacylglycerol kinase family protein [Candidatus Korobacteraceae bacterium]
MPAFHKVLLLYNPVAGSKHSARTRELLSAAQVFRDAGVEVELEPTRAKGEGGRQAKAALERDFDAIFACGGDGTVFDVLQGMVHGPEQVALGVLPLGTANVLATDLGLPDEITAAARVTLGYVPRRIAAGQLRWNRTPDQQEERTMYFSVAAGMGVHAELIYDATALLKQHGGFAAYYVAGLSLLVSHEFTPFSAEITLPDGSRRREELLEVVGMRVSSFGKWLSRWRPGGALGHDYLQLITLKPSSRLAMFRYVISAIFRGAGPESKSRSARVEFVRALCVRFRLLHPSSTARLRAQADGEVLSGMPAEMSIVPRALTLLMPPSQ